ERTLRRRRPSVHHGSPWDVILLKIIGRRGLPLLALLRAAIAVIPLAAHQRHVRHPQGEVRLAVMLAGAEFAGHAQLRTLRDVLANLCEAVAPGAAIQPERLLLVAEAAVHGQRKPCHLRVAGLSGHRVLPDTADCVETVHACSLGSLVLMTSRSCVVKMPPLDGASHRSICAACGISAHASATV